MLQLARLSGDAACGQVQDGIGRGTGGEPACDAARVDEKDPIPTLDERVVRVTEENDIGTGSAPLRQQRFHADLGAVAMAVGHKDPPSPDAQEEVERKHLPQVAVAPDGIEGERRERTPHGNHISLAITAVQDARDVRVPANRLPQAVRVAVRVGDDQDADRDETRGSRAQMMVDRVLLIHAAMTGSTRCHSRSYSTRSSIFSASRAFRMLEAGT